jgi:quercetin dioxygenase-like cupin family protein
MFRPVLVLLTLAFVVAALPHQLRAQSSGGTAHAFISASDLVWNDFDPPGFPPGATIAVVHGDPGSTGPYTVRISLPDGYEIPLHWHSGDETLTVLSGTFLLSMGDRRDDRRLEAFRAGDVLFIPAEHRHFGGVEGPTVVQLHGIGPFTTTVVDPGAGGGR